MFGVVIFYTCLSLSPKTIVWTQVIVCGKVMAHTYVITSSWAARSCVEL